MNELEEGNKLNLQFQKREGLLPVIVQEQKTGEVLMLAYTNETALRHTLEHHVPAFWSTSRNQLWIKGETSGNTLKLHSVHVDCDQDALVYKVSLQDGGICHTKKESGENRKSCFYRRLDLDTNKLIFD